MKLVLLFFVLIISKTTSFAQQKDPFIPKNGSALNKFVPKGWKMILQTTGDLNKDGMADVVLVIEDTDPKNLRGNNGLGERKLNLNPRILLVIFKINGDNYELATKNSGFIPSENEEESTCLADPLMQEGGISIQNGSLKISYQYWFSCGSWYITNKDYTFRYQNQKFELIGYDDSNLHRSSGEKSSTSINFSTKKMSITTGGNEFNDKDDKPSTIWKTLRPSKLLSLATLTDDILTDYLEKVAP